MKHKFIFSSLVILAACSQPDAAVDQTGEWLPALPAGARTEAAPDVAGMVRVNLQDDAGKLSAAGVYVNNKREGSWTEYHSNGLVKSITPYVNGLKEGIFVELSETGQLLRRVSYHRDQRDGEYREYNFSTLKEERFYANGKLEGAVKIYYPDGKIMEEGNYVNGLRDGASKWYDQQGNLTIEYEYKAGELVKK